MTSYVYRSRTHPKVLFVPFLIQLILVALAIGVYHFWPNSVTWQWAPWIAWALFGVLEVLYVLMPILRWWNNVFIVSVHKVSNEWGIVYKNSREIEISRIASISESRGMLDRIFGCGTLNFYDAAAAAQPQEAEWNRKSALGVQFSDVPRVSRVKNIIDNIRENRPADSGQVD